MSRDADVFEDDRTFLNIIATMSNWDVDKLRKVLVLFSFCSRHEQKLPRNDGFSKNVGEKCVRSASFAGQTDKIDGKLLFKRRLVTIFVKMCGYLLNTCFLTKNGRAQNNSIKKGAFVKKGSGVNKRLKLKSDAQTKNVINT